MDVFLENPKQTNQTESIRRFPGIECPEINCVLFGRFAWDYPGNIEFRGLLREIEQGQKERDREMPGEMNSMIEKVIQESLFRNFHFLIYNRNTFLYMEVTECKEIWKLVEQSVREHRKRIRAKRIIDETKLEIGKNINQNIDKDVSNISTDICVGHQTIGGGKFTKDCNGWKCLVGEEKSAR